MTQEQCWRETIQLRKMDERTINKEVQLIIAPTDEMIITVYNYMETMPIMETMQ